MNDRAHLPGPVRPRSPGSRTGALAAALALCAPAALGQHVLHGGHNPPVQLLRGARTPAGGTLAGTFTTIQAAVNAALSGDTVLIPAGLYTGLGNRDVSVTKNVTITGEGPGQTIVDCEEEGRGFLFSGALGNDTCVLERLTIQNGVEATGGGIEIAANASPTLRELEIRSCSATSAGGAIFGADRNTWDADGLLLHDNHAGLIGGAIGMMRPMGALANCVLEDNTSGSVGGGLGIINNFGPDGQPGVRISDSLFRGNSAAGAGGGFYSEMADSYFVDRCTFVSNSAVNAGGGIEVLGDLLSPLGTDVVFFQNCLIARNSAPLGGGMRTLLGSAIVQNCTIADNEASGHTGGLLAISDGLFLLNTILWGNVSPDASLQTQQLDFGAVNPALLLVFYNDVQGGAPDPTSISEDPLFVAPESGDYHLGAGSPCINRGLPAFSFVLAQMDIDGQPRIFGNEIDIGADERVVDRRPVRVRSAAGLQ